MVSRRNFLSIAAIMLVTFFMFQFTNVALDLLNDYEENKYAVDVGSLTGRAAAFGADPGGIPAQTPWGTDRPCVAYIGGTDRPSGQIAAAWAAYSKRELIAAADLTAYSPWTSIPAPARGCSTMPPRAPALSSPTSPVRPRSGVSRPCRSCWALRRSARSARMWRKFISMTAFCWAVRSFTR